MNNNPIGIIDSGVGGLTIASKIIETLPGENIVFVGDSKNTPYGRKSRDEIYSLTKKMINFLISQNIKLLVVACNTITVSCIFDLRRDYPQIPIVGIVPVIKTAVKETKNKKIGILSTEVTAKSKYQKDLIEKFAKGVKVLNIGTNSLVPFIEKLDFGSIDGVLKRELKVFKESGIDVLALGSTHFPLVKDQIQKFLPKVKILDSSEAVSKHVKRVLKQHRALSNLSNPSYTFYTSGDISKLRIIFEKLGLKGKAASINNGF